MKHAWKPGLLHLTRRLSGKPRIPRLDVPGLSVPASRLVCGGARDWTENVRDFRAVLDTYVACGGNTYDTAAIYQHGCHAESRLGRWLDDRGLRRQSVLIVKGGHRPECRPECLGRDLAHSFHHLRTHWVDIHILHTDNPDVPVGEFADALDRIRRDGLSRLCGVSNWSHARWEAAQAWLRSRGRKPLDVLSNHFSLATWHRPMWDVSADCRGPEWEAWLERHRPLVLSWSALTRGFFCEPPPPDPERDAAWDHPANRERRKRVLELARRRRTRPALIALAWILHQPFPVLPIVGCRTPAEMEELPAAFQIALSPAECAWLDLRRDGPDSPA